MVSLLAAIKTALDADGTYVALITLTVHGMAPTGTAFDYVEFEGNSSPPEITNTGTTTIEDFPVLFRAFSTTPNLAEAIIDQLVIVLKAMATAITGGVIMDVTKETQTLFEDPDRTPEGGIVWVSSTILTFRVHRGGS